MIESFPTWDLLIIWSYIFDKVFLCTWMSQKQNLNSYFHFQNSWALGKDVDLWITIGNHYNKMIDKPDSVVSFMISVITRKFPSTVVSMIRRDTKFLKLCELSWFKTTIFHLKPINPPLEVCYLDPQLVRILSRIAKALHVLPNENGPLTRLIQKHCPTYTAEQT